MGHQQKPVRLAGAAVLSLQSDERLAALARAGYERAFDAIVARYRRPLVRFCARIVPESRSEDAVQQALVNAHRALVEGEAPVQLRPWLYAIARNAALNVLRQNGWNHEQIPADVDGVLRPDEVVEQRMQLEGVVASVSELPERQRSALVMRELEGRRYDEIALALGTGEGAVRQLLNRARAGVRRAATLLTPPPLLARLASELATPDGPGPAQVVTGLGAAGLAKAGATALVAGSLVVGAPLVVDHRGPQKPAAAHQLRATRVSRVVPAAVAAVERRHSGSDSATHDRQERRERRSGSDDRSGRGSGASRGGRGGDDHSGGRDTSSGTSGRGPSGTSGDGTSGSSGGTGPSGSSTSDGGGSGSSDGGSGSSDGGSGSSSSGSGSLDSGSSGSSDGGSGSSGSGSSGSDRVIATDG